MGRWVAAAAVICLIAGCGSDRDESERVVDEAIEDAKAKADSIADSYGEPSGCMDVPFSAVVAAYPGREPDAKSKLALKRDAPNYVAVHGDAIPGFQGDMEFGTYYVATPPVDGLVPVFAMSERAFKTGTGTVLRDNVVRQLKSATDEADRARGCALQRAAQ
jgi:hypothetical protein